MALLLLIALLLVVVSIPKVQTKIAQHFTEKINNSYDVNISVSKIRIGYNGDIQLRNVYIEDHQQDTMIFVGKLTSSANSILNLMKSEIAIDDISLDEVVFNIVKYKDEETDNFDLFLNNLEDEKEASTSSKKFEMFVQHIIISQGNFLYKDENEEIEEQFKMNDLYIDAWDFSIIGSLVEADIRRLKGLTGRGFNVEKLATEFSYSRNQMKFLNTSLTTDVSTLLADITLSYEIEDFKDFNNCVTFDANFSYADISTTDLGKFYSEFGYNEQLKFNGILEGVLNDFTAKDLFLSGLRRSQIRSQELTFQYLLNRERDFVLEGNFSQLTTDREDLSNLLPRVLGDNLPNDLAKFGLFNLNGFIRIEGPNLYTNTNASTEVGKAKLQLTFNDLDQQEKVTYDGVLVFDNIAVDQLANNKILGNTSFSLEVNGKGFTRESLDTKVKGNIKKIHYNKYTFQNIDINGNLKHPIFEGNFISKDKNFQVDFNGLLDLSEEENNFNFYAHIDQVELNKINWYTKDSISEIKGDITLQLKGNEIDEFVGKLDLQNFVYTNQIDSFVFTDLELTSSITDEIRDLEISSTDVVDGYLKGIFKPTELPEIVLGAVENLYYREEPKENKNFAYVDFKFSIYNKIIEAIFPQIYFAPNTFVEGSIVNNQNYFRLGFESPQIKVYENSFNNIDLLIDNKDPLINTSVKIDSIVTPFYKTSQFSFINQTQNDTLFVRANIKGGPTNTDDFDLKFYQTSTEKKELIFGFLPSTITFKEYDWKLGKENSTQNRLIIQEGFRNFEFDSISVVHEDAYFKLNGIVRDSTYKNIQLDLNKIELAKITPIIDSLELNGIVDGKLSLLQEKGLYSPNLDAQIYDFTANNFSYGDFSLFADGDERFTRFNFIASLIKDGKHILESSGQIYENNNRQNIEGSLVAKDFDVSPLSPLGVDIIDNFRGFLEGKVDFSGRLNEPQFEGSLLLADGGINVPYLNVDVNFTEKTTINVLPTAFVFTNVSLEDTKHRTKGRLDGLIAHRNFDNWELDLNVGGDNLLVLDTPYKEGSLYYGTAFIAGNAEIFGPVDNLEINVNARTLKNTVFSIPLDDTEFLTDASFIYFLTEADKQAKEEGRSIQLREVKGISMNFDLDITEDAEVEIVVDKASGSTLRGRGTGNLLIEINTNGKFTMFGDFEAAEGIYDFRYAGIVNKKFSVVPGGTLTWNGDPLQANMNVQAKYRTMANPAFILENPLINRDVPVEVFINLSGELIQPNINFELNYPNLSSIIKSELEYRIQGKENTEIQALSLVTQGTFYNMDGIGGQGAIAGNLVEGASSIMDRLFSDEEGKFKVGLDYTQAQRVPDQNQTGDRVGMSFQTQISDRILINGRFGVPVGGTTESVIFGDVEVNLLLNDSGSLRANAFNRESDIQFIGEELAYTQGIGLSYSIDFNSFNDLLRKMLKKEALRPKQNDIPEKEPSKSVLPSYIRLPHENLMEQGEN